MQLSRKQFLAELVASISLASHATYAGAEDQPASVSFSLGYSLYGMRSIPIHEALTTCSRIGYEAIEICALPAAPSDPEKLSTDDRSAIRRQLVDLGLCLCAVMENLPLAATGKDHQTNLKRLQEAAELGQILSPDASPPVETVIGGKPGEWETLKDQFARNLRDWASAIESHGVPVLIKPHRFGAMNTPEMAKWLVEKVASPWVGLAYDFSHFQFREPAATMTLESTLGALQPLTKFIHAKDVALDSAGKPQFLLPGQGTVNYANLFRKLQASGYSGCVCVEVAGGIQSAPGYDPVSAAEQSFEPLRAARETVSRL